MSEVAYEPEAGDLVWLDFDPRIGRKQSGRWQARFLTSHVRRVGAVARPLVFAGGVVPAGVLAEVRAKLAVLCGMG